MGAEEAQNLPPQVSQVEDQSSSNTGLLNVEHVNTFQHLEHAPRRRTLQRFTSLVGSGRILASGTVGG
jgi:hypothetical protein